MSNIANRVSSYKTSIKMRETLPKASAILLMITLLAVLFNVAALMSQTFSDKAAPKAIKGDLDLAVVSLSSVPSVPLSGNWAFHWLALLTPEQVKAGGTEVDYLDVPHAWIRETLNSEPMPSKGFATYHLNVSTDKHYPSLALKIPTMGTAYKLFVDENLIASGGTVAETPEVAHSAYNPQIVLIAPKSREFSLTLQVSNHDFYWGGTWSPLRIGLPEPLFEEHLRHTIRSTILLAIFLTVALFNLIQFTLRTADPLPVIISLTCLLLGLREIESSHVLHVAGITQWTFETNVRINFLTFFLAVPSMVAYFHLNFPKDYNAKILGLIYIVSAIFSGLVLLTPPDVFSPSMPWYQGFVLLLMPYLFWGLIQAVRHKRKSARLLMIGTLFLFALVLNDILYNLDLINTTLMVGFGLVAFVLCQNYLTYIRFISDSRQKVLLSQTLEERNKELEEFSQSLEEKVNLRTQELEKANEQLEELAHKDMLTDLPNRRGMTQSIEDAMVAFWQKRTPFCILLMDFDNFKRLNDTLGHEVGDQVLSEGAAVVRAMLRDIDTVGRWGGEEFLFLLPNTPASGAEILANKVRKMLRDTLSQSIKSPVSVTIGVAEFQQGETLDICIKRADQALYKGKDQGRDQVVVAGITIEDE